MSRHRELLHVLMGSPRRRRWLLATVVYLVTTAVYVLFCDDATFERHTPYNHFALLAESWLKGRLDLGAAPPEYALGNDFALYEGRWYVTFPPFPALLLVPALWLAGGVAERVADGAWFVALAGVAPALLFLVLQKLERMGESRCSERTQLAVSLLFAFGSVYFFCAVQGTVWYAAHVVAATLSAAYVLFALGADRPCAAGVVLGLGFLTRTPLLLALPLFAYEAWRASQATNGALDRRALARRLAWFSAPLMLCVAVALLQNQLRFDAWLDFGYRHLTVRWQERIERYGLFDYRFLGRNLAVILTSLPWTTPPEYPTAFRINAHGLALWLTTPLYLWLLWPRRRSGLFCAFAATALFVALPTLFYQNTGWVQFGYRFSNDYAVFLFAMLALGGYRMGYWFRALGSWAIVVNAFGALSFGRPAYRAYYYIEPTQRVLHQPD